MQEYYCWHDMTWKAKRFYYEPSMNETELTIEWKLVSWKSSDIILSNKPESEENGSSNPGSFFTILKSKEECSMSRLKM